MKEHWKRHVPLVVVARGPDDLLARRDARPVAEGRDERAVRRPGAAFVRRAAEEFEVRRVGGEALEVAQHLVARRQEVRAREARPAVARDAFFFFLKPFFGWGACSLQKL